jgi:5''-nucleotidase/2'',3''-cyclic phosphodiesterase and related esterases
MNKTGKVVFSLAAAALCVVAACFILLLSGRPADGEYSFQVLTTNDVHGTYFDSTYVGDKSRKSLFAVKRTVDSVRAAVGAENVILLEAGDFLQGDNATYWFNYVDTLSPHIYPRLAAYMGYDAVTLGNHDIETGHAVYDRVAAELEAAGIPALAGNAIRTDNGKPYFRVYTILKRHGIKIAVLGFTNANIKNWLSEKIWSGMTFENLIPLVQEDVDMVIRKEKPQVVIASLHTATGDGDGSMLESQGLDLMKTLHGVDFIICSHDHRPVTIDADTVSLINAGSHCRFVGKGVIDLTVKGGKVVKRSLSSSLIPVDAANLDTAMAAAFRPDYLKVKEFTTTPIGTLKADLMTRDAYTGMCDYVNLVHYVSLGCKPARVSFAAPLTYNGKVSAGTLLFNDLFTIYPFENQLYVVKMTGSEIKNYLECSYDQWINTVSGPEQTLLKIRNSDDPRTGQKRWSFVERAYNFDSAGGLVYSVDVTKEMGDRISIKSFADGSAFDLGETYGVAMTSYRASGGGDLLKNAGVDTDRIDDRVLEYNPELREIIYSYIKQAGCIDPAVIGDRKVVGEWSFVPERIAAPALERDFHLLFGE